MKPEAGGKLARAAGTFVQLVGRDTDYALLRLGSGEVRRVHLECLATIGAVSNPDQQNIVIGKAGRSRWLGIRPVTRGIAMNPVDHPHGGRTNGGMHWVTPWGVSTKGKKTRHNKRTDGMILRRRHAAKKA
jgi:large subunit ribosomal protein L2